MAEEGRCLWCSGLGVLLHRTWALQDHPVHHAGRM